MIHICFNLDEKYVIPCKVLIKQIDDKTTDKITYHFIGINTQDMETRNKCKFYPNPDLSYFENETLGDYAYFSQAAMYRLLIPFLINTDRAIYMDCDMVVLKDMKLLWNKQIDYVGAVIDPCEIFRKKILKIDSKNYFNSGLILFDSKKIRENMPDYKERLLKAQKEYTLVLRDQDLFNIVFKEHITHLGYEFNIDANNAKEEKETKATTKAKDKAFRNPVIVHCMGSNKWWDVDGLAFGTYWNKYAGEYLPEKRKYSYKYNDLLIIRN